jgi:hypothetical protein
LSAAKSLLGLGRGHIVAHPQNNMKTTFTLNPENAQAIDKYAQLISADPDQFLNDLVHDYCTEAFASDSGTAIGHLTSRGFPTRQAAEKFRAWLVAQIAQDERECGWPIAVDARVEQSSSGRFWIKGTETYNGMTFKF